MTALHPACDRAAIRPARAKPPAGRPPLVLATSILASSLAFIDGSVVNVGLPAIGHSLAADPAGLQWIVNAYLLPLSALLLLGGALGDRFGRRRLLVVGIALFAFASLAGGFATDQAWLLIARVIQGIGGALAAPTSLSLIAVTFPEGKERNRALGVLRQRPDRPAGAAAGAARAR